MQCEECGRDMFWLERLDKHVCDTPKCPNYGQVRSPQFMGWEWHEKVTQQQNERNLRLDVVGENQTGWTLWTAIRFEENVAREVDWARHVLATFYNAFEDREGSVWMVDCYHYWTKDEVVKALDHERFDRFYATAVIGKSVLEETS